MTLHKISWQKIIKLYFYQKSGVFEYFSYDKCLTKKVNLARHEGGGRGLKR